MSCDRGVGLAYFRCEYLPPSLPPSLPPDSDSESEPEDEVRLWEDGWKDRYYSNKFGVPSKDEEFVRSVVRVLNPFYQFETLASLALICMGDLNSAS